MVNKEYFYPLYKDEDQSLFNLLAKNAQNMGELEFIEEDNEFSTFMKLFVYSGKMKDYRQFWNALRKSLERGELNLKELIKYGEGLEIQRGIDESWAIFTQDKRICILLDEFYDSEIKFEGEGMDRKELFLRFWLSQLLQDWRGPKLVVMIKALEENNVNVKQLNKVLSKWDFTGIFN